VTSTIRRLAREEAQTMVEYTVVLAVITLAIVTSYGLLSGSIQRILELVTGVFS
jgi:Flp pilus assembly pilin Flp